MKDVGEFVAQLESYWGGHRQEDSRIEAICRKVRGYDGHRLQAIYEWLVDNCEYFPKAVDVRDAITATWESKSKQEVREHECERCEGNGLVLVVYAIDRTCNPCRYVYVKDVPISVKPKVEHGHQAVGIRRCECKNAKRWPKAYPLISDVKSVRHGSMDRRPVQTVPGDEGEAGQDEGGSEKECQGEIPF